MGASENKTGLLSSTIACLDQPTIHPIFHIKTMVNNGINECTTCDAYECSRKQPDSIQQKYTLIIFTQYSGSNIIASRMSFHSPYLKCVLNLTKFDSYFNTRIQTNEWIQRNEWIRMNEWKWMNEYEWMNANEWMQMNEWMTANWLQIDCK